MIRLGLDARKLADFGIGTYVHHLVLELARRRAEFDVTLFARPSGRSLLPDLPPSVRWIDDGSRGYSARELLQMGLKVRRQRLDLFHAPHYVVPVALGAPFVVTVHDVIHLLFPQFLPSRLGYPYARFMLRRALGASRRVIAVSETTRRDLLSRSPATPPEKVVVVPNGIDEAFREVTDGAVPAALARLGLRRPYLLFVGNPKRHKDLPTALAALARLEAAPGRPTLALAGTGESAEIAAAARRVGVEERVQALGFVPPELLPALYRGAELLLSPSLYEGFGFAVAEALAAGCPVVASDIPAHRELAGDAALYAPPGAAEAFAAGAARLLADRELALGQREAGRRRVAPLTWEAAGRRTIEVYRAALSPDGGAPR